ncbi:hypothetical protein [Shimia haliotis]|nr:hypothetical protein [Shimia haliotis]
MSTAKIFLTAKTMMTGIWLRGCIHILAMIVALNIILELFCVSGRTKTPCVHAGNRDPLPMQQCLMLMNGRHFRHSSIVKKHIRVHRLASEQRVEPSLPRFEDDIPAATPVVINMPPLRAPKPTFEVQQDDVVINVFATSPCTKARTNRQIWLPDTPATAHRTAQRRSHA